MPSTASVTVGDRAAVRSFARLRPSPALVVALVAIAILLVRAAHYLPFMVDDAFISLRYADRFAEGKGLTWTDGERVEGYTNFLWVICVALLRFVGFDAVLAARLLGLVAMSAALCAIVYAHARPTARSALPALFGSFALALAGPAAVWAIGGLEQPLLAALVAWGIVFTYPLLDVPPASARRILLPGTLLGLACLTRPDGVLFGASACLAVVLALGPWRGASWRTAVLLGVPSLGACVGQTLFRRIYYDDWLPNTAYVKLALTPDRFSQGLAYLGGGARHLAPLLLVAAVGAFPGIVDVRGRRRALLLVLPLVVWCIYVTSIGGDIFPGWRHLLVAIVLLCLLAAQGVEGLVQRTTGRRWIVPLVAAVLLLVLGVQQARDSENRRAAKEQWEWNGLVVGRLLKAAFPERAPLLAVDPAGCIPYASGLPALDMLGLNDRHIAHHGAPWFGKRQLGHELGDGAYVLSRKPDLVLFCGPAGHDIPCYVSGFEMADIPAFHQEYAPVVFEAREGEPFRSFVWARKETGRVGVERSETGVTVPGFLLGLGSGVVARLDAGGRLVADLEGGGMAIYRGLTLLPGRWTVRVEKTGGPVNLRIHSALNGDVLAEGEAPVFVVDQPKALDLEVLPPADARAEIARIVFARE